MPSPSRSTLPDVGGINPVRQRTSAHLPDPESPMTANTSPGATPNDTSRTQATQPVSATQSAPDNPPLGPLMTCSGFDPKTFPYPRTEMVAEESWAPSTLISVVTGSAQKQTSLTPSYLSSYNPRLYLPPGGSLEPIGGLRLSITVNMFRL